MRYHKSTTIKYEMLRTAVDWSGVLIKLKHFRSAVILLVNATKYVTNSVTLDTIASLLDEAQKQLSLLDFEEAHERGKTLNLETVVQELLDEFGQADE